MRHLIVEDRRRRVLLADDDAHRERDLAAIPDFEAVLGNVDENVPLAEIRRQPAPALEIQRDLLDALRDGHVELRDGRGADGAVGFEPVPALESLDGLLQFRRRRRCPASFGVPA